MRELLNCGGPAFATSNECQLQTGMTLMDWFAGQALVGLISSESSSAALAKQDGPLDAVMAGAAYEMAAAMITERNKLSFK